MASGMLRACSFPGCPEVTRELYCTQHRDERIDLRPSASRRGYNERWRRVRLRVLAEEPLCRRCAAAGRVKPAMDVHHRDGNVLNLSRDNLEPLCHECHSRETASTHRGRW